MKFFLILLFLSFNLHAQQIDTAASKLKIESNFSNPRKIQAYLIPAVFIGYGIISLEDNAVRKLDLNTKLELSEDHPRFAAHIDNYIQFAPFIALYGLEIAGLKGKSSTLDQMAMTLLTTGMTTIVVTTLKAKTHRLRPDGSNYHSFPSGHTAIAFAAAEQLHQEFKNRSPWIGYAGYAVAAATGILRTYNNKHWASDVVAGAGMGIISTKLTYLLYPYLKKIISPKTPNLTLAPTYLNKQLGYSLSYKLR